MNSGLTIAFISVDKTKPSVINFNKFGTKFWDDSKLINKSKVGYYLAYYYQKKYVYIHKIINILSPINKPIEMACWETTNNILCLSERLVTFTWEDWKSGYGKEAPYTPGEYHNTRTYAWSYDDLKIHGQYKLFDFTRLIQLIQPVQQSKIELIIKDKNNELDKYIEVEEYEEDADEVAIRDLTEQLEKLNAKKEEKMKINEIKKNVHILREKTIKLINEENDRFERKIKRLIAAKTENNAKINSIAAGEQDDDLIQKAINYNIKGIPDFIS